MTDLDKLIAWLQKTRRGNEIVDGGINEIEQLRARIAELEAELKELKPCTHERGTIYNHKVYPATHDMPSEETGRVECRDCGEVWELGYQPKGMDLRNE